MADETNVEPTYLWSVAGKKISIMGAKAAVAIAAAFLAKMGAYKFGWNVHLEQFQAEVAAAILLGMEWLHDFLKVKTGVSWL